MLMKIPCAVPITGLLIGFPGLLRALFMLDRDPLSAVLGLLACMALLLASVAFLCGDDYMESARSVKDRSRL